MAPRKKKDNGKVYTHELGNKAKIRDGIEKPNAGRRHGVPGVKLLKNNKMGKITNEKELKKYAGNKINYTIDEGGRRIKQGADSLIGRIGSKIKEKGGDKKIVDYGTKRISQGIENLVRQGSGAAKRWIHTEGKQALQRGAQEIGNKVKQGWEDLKSKFRR